MNGIWGSFCNGFLENLNLPKLFAGKLEILFGFSRKYRNNRATVYF